MWQKYHVMTFNFLSQLQSGMVSAREWVTWWRTTFWANYKGEWKWSVVQETDMPYMIIGAFVTTRPIPYLHETYIVVSEI